MSKIFQYFKTVRNDLKYILYTAISLYILIEFFLIEYPEIFPYGFKIGQLISKLSISYLSAFIFYFIVVHIKSEKDKENINEYVGHKVYSIITSARLITLPIIRKSNEKADFKYLELEDLQKLLSSVKRNDKSSPLIINNENANWIEWYEYLKNSTEKSISELYKRYLHLDSELIKKITRIENSLFLTQFELLYNFNYDDSLKIYLFQIHTYLNLIKDLEEYAEKKNLKKFQYRNGDFVGTK